MSAPRRHDLRVLPAAIGACLTGWLATSSSARPCAWLAGLTLLLALVILVAPRLRRRSLGPPVALALVVAGLCCANTGLHHHLRAIDPIAPAIADSDTVEIWGTVHADPRPRAEPGESDLTTLAEVSVRAWAGGAQEPQSSRLTVLILGTDDWQPLAVGDQVRARGRLRPTEPADSIDGLFVASEVRLERGASGLAGTANRMRTGLMAATADLPTDARALIPGIAVGDTTRFEPDLSSAMRAAGLTHITAVSGAHLVVVIAALSWLLSLVRMRRPAKAVVLVAALAFFVVLVRPEPSVLRASAMALVGVLAMVLGRPRWALPALLAGVSVLVVADPWLTRSYGFALSAAATGALVTLAPWWTRQLARIMPRALAGMVAIPAAAQAVCAPIIVLFSPTVSLVAVPANLLAAPAVAPVTVAGVLAALIAPVYPPAAIALAAAASWPARWIGAVARWSTSLTWSQLPWAGGIGGALALAVVTAIVLAGAGWLVHRGRRAALVATAAIVVIGLVCAIPPVWRQIVRLGSGAAPMSAWQVAVCDVGQGSATVLRTGDSSALVADVGPNSSAAAQCLDYLGIRRISTLVISHFHADHVGGLAQVAAGRTIERVIAPASCGSDPEVREVDGILAEHHLRTEWIEASSGPVTDHSGPVAWTAFPPARDGPCGQGAEGTEVNNSSLPFYAHTDGLSLVVLGDAEEEGQRHALGQLRGLAQPMTVDVVVVPHHGSARQYEPLARFLSAPIALVSVGADNTYGHPTESALRLYREGGARVLRTDECGTIAIAARAGGFDLDAHCPA